MHVAFEAARALSILAFFGYGLSCLVSKHMVAEFERYGLARLRVLTGTLEIAGALGLLVGYLLPPFTIAAAAGLSLLMCMGILTRIRIRDPLSAMLPALFFLAVSLFVLACATGALGGTGQVAGDRGLAGPPPVASQPDRASHRAIVFPEVILCTMWCSLCRS